MAIRNAADISVVTQGLYQVPIKIKTEENQYSYLRDVLFGGPSVSSNLDYIVMDYESLGVPLAKEAIKGADPTRVNYGTPFNEKAIFGMYFNDEDEVNEGQADNRVSMEEPLDNPWSLEERMIYLLSKKRDRIAASQAQSFEKACADVLLSGQVAVKNGGTQVFPMTTSLLSVTGSGLATDPIGTLLAGIKMINKKKGGRPTTLVMNPDDAAAFLQLSAIKDLLDNRRIFGNEVEYKAMEESGAAYCGSINLPGTGTVKIVSYYGNYDVAGTPTYYIPAGKAVLCPDRVGRKGYCGVFLDNGTFSGKAAAEFGTHIWRKEGPVPYTTHVQVQSAPIPMLTAIDRYCVFTGISFS